MSLGAVWIGAASPAMCRLDTFICQAREDVAHRVREPEDALLEAIFMSLGADMHQAGMALRRVGLARSPGAALARIDAARGRRRSGWCAEVGAKTREVTGSGDFIAARGVVRAGASSLPQRLRWSAVSERSSHGIVRGVLVQDYE